VYAACLREYIFLNHAGWLTVGKVCSGEAADDGCSSPCFTSMEIAVKPNRAASADPRGLSESVASSTSGEEVGTSC
jgi:hypothetical protein